MNTIHGSRDDATALRAALGETDPDVVLDLIPYTEAQPAALGRAVASETAAGRTYNVGEPDALPEATWLRRFATAAGINTTTRTAPDEQVERQPPFDWQYSMATDTRRIRTGLSVAEPVAHTKALRRTIAWEREQGA